MSRRCRGTTGRFLATVTRVRSTMTASPLTIVQPRRGRPPEGVGLDRHVIGRVRTRPDWIFPPDDCVLCKFVASNAVSTWHLAETVRIGGQARRSRDRPNSVTIFRSTRR